MERLGQFHPYHVSSPTELKIEFTVEATPVYRPREGVERLNERTYIFRGKDIVEAWLKWGDF
jgi:hypothetical protein